MVMVTFLFITRSKKVQSDVKVNKSIMTVNKMRANWMINHFSISILIFSINCFILSISCFTRSRHPHTLKRHSSKRNVALPKNIAKDNESNNQQDLKKYWPGKSTQNANDDEQSGSSEFWPVANKRSRSSDRWQKEYGISEGTAGMLSMIQNKNEIGQNSSKRFQKALNKNSYLIKKFEGPRAIICNKEKPFKVAGGRRGISDEGGGKFDYKSMSSSFWRLDYDYLSTSLNAIEVKPALSFEKSDDFLLNWWHFAKKWDVLGSELLGIDLKQLDDVLTSDSMSVLDTGLEMGVGSMDDRESMATNAESENIQKVFAVSSNVKEVHSRNRLLTALRELCEINLARVICVGDVHGCEHELRDLLKAVNYRPCDCVLLLGDMVGKGPRSVNVVKMAREIGAVATCGNHDHEVIRRAQIDRRANSSKPKESSSRPSEHLRIARALSDEDIAWMERLPYAIFSPDLGSLFVHAAVQNDRELERQSPWVVMMARSVRPDGSMSCRCEYDSPWAKGWKGPLTCYFGHDAARGLQIYEHAVGLDTGCVYGGRLTAILLPEKEIVSVPARQRYRDSRCSSSHRSFKNSRKMKERIFATEGSENGGRSEGKSKLRPLEGGAATSERGDDSDGDGEEDGHEEEDDAEVDGDDDIDVDGDGDGDHDGDGDVEGNGDGDGDGTEVDGDGNAGEGKVDSADR